ncbi:Os05g0203300 [Oryza sativa Japonica Group]|uniref:Os05g0203300 protein n=1 Tax=Oryza sativa subsp. japonica TaxID=39947 RepID=A0A0P0WJC8_ORYSJ|nr:hypothetical protein EE612_027735 [Oryza sativa]BAS92733.1 Os05g0203300 [Oryza sativa Japonica Group]
MTSISAAALDAELVGGEQPRPRRLVVARRGSVAVDLVGADVDEAADGAGGAFRRHGSRRTWVPSTLFLVNSKELSSTWVWAAKCMTVLIRSARRRWRTRSAEATSPRTKAKLGDAIAGARLLRVAQ